MLANMSGVIRRRAPWYKERDVLGLYGDASLTLYAMLGEIETLMSKGDWVADVVWPPLVMCLLKS
jgi:hypothetical protein